MLKELNLKDKGHRPTSGLQQRSSSANPQPGILKVPLQNQPVGKKTKQGISLDLSAMIDALEV
jgi:hypothetical protein